MCASPRSIAISARPRTSRPCSTNCRRRASRVRRGGSDGNGRWAPRPPAATPSLSDELSRRTWHLHVLQQLVHRGMESLPRRLAVALVAHDDRIAGIEALVEHVPPGEFRPDQVPNQLVKLEPIERRHRGRAPPALEAVLE